MKEREPGQKPMYVGPTWAVKKSQYVAGMRVLRWMSQAGQNKERNN